MTSVVNAKFIARQHVEHGLVGIIVVFLHLCPLYWFLSFTPIIPISVSVPISVALIQAPHSVQGHEALQNQLNDEKVEKNVVDPKPTPKPKPKTEPKPKTKPKQETVKPIPNQVKTENAITEYQEESSSSEEANANNATRAAMAPIKGNYTAINADTGVSFNAAYLNNPQPPYPMMSRRRKEEGVVYLKVYVQPNGHPSEVTLKKTSGYERLDNSALNTVKNKWKFEPAKQQGKPIAAWVIVPIKFRLES